MKRSLDATGSGSLFAYYILSDTSSAAVAAAEEAAVAAWRGEGGAITYRRRADNAGFKAGNIRDFCERWGGGHDPHAPARRG